MAEAVAVAEVNAESVVPETTETLSTVKETEPEAPEAPEGGAPVAADEEPVTEGAPDHKRKLEDLEPLGGDEAPAKRLEIHGSEPTSEDSVPAEDDSVPAEDEPVPPPEAAAQEIGSELTDGSGHPTAEGPVTSMDVAASDTVVDGEIDEQQLGQDGETDGAGLQQVKLEAVLVGNGQIESTENMQEASVDDTQENSSLAPEQGSLSHARQQTSNDLSTSRKIDVPNNKVGVLIGKSGDTIRYLQINSGAKIQITRDVDANPDSSIRPVELIGTLENITKAEQLIKDVIAEADAGGSPSLVARGFSAPQSGGEQTEIQIPNEKVGMIIGKGGETIKSLQTKTGARIQLIPQHLPEGDSSKERTVRITGNKKQVEYAKEMIKDVMNQVEYQKMANNHLFVIGFTSMITSFYFSFLHHHPHVLFEMKINGRGIDAIGRAPMYDDLSLFLSASSPSSSPFRSRTPPFSPLHINVPWFLLGQPVIELH